MTNASNTYRKVRALVMKTVANGCTPGEAVSAVNLASKIVADHGLDPTRIDWPTAPAGYEWDGEPGRGGKVVEKPAMAEPATKSKRAKAKSAEPKQPRRTKKEIIIAMLRQPGGTTIDAITALFGTKPHSARAAISVYGRLIGGVTYDPANKSYRANVAA